MTSHDPFPDSEQQGPEPFRPDFSEGLETGLYLALLELIDEGLVITGDETIIEVNSAACRLLEREYRTLAGQPLATLFPSEKAFLDARERLLVQGQMRGSLHVALPGARQRTLRFIAAARIRPGIHALILSPDIIAETYADRAVGDTLWPELAATMTQGLIVIDSADHIAAANASAQRSLALASDRLVGREIETLFRIQYETTGRTPRVTLHGTAGGTRMHGRMLNGPRPGWRILVLDPSPTPQGMPPQRTSRAAATPGLLAFEQSPLPALLCTTGDHRILEANAAATRVFGRSLESLQKLTIRQLRADGEGSPISSGNWRVRHPDGRTFESHFISWPVGDPVHPDAFVVTQAWPAAPVWIVSRRKQ